MKKVVFSKLNKLLILIVSSIIFLLIQNTNGQYYYFDELTTSFPYQQGCNEELYVRINTQSTPIRAGRFHLILDDTKFDYSKSIDANILRANLFLASTQTFLDRSSSISPSWKTGSNYTILQIDRKNDITNYNGNGGLYGTIKFIPFYNIAGYSGFFSMEYNPGPDTTETTLSLAGGIEAINQSEQSSRLSGDYIILQEPCIADTNNPNISISTPTNGGDKQNFLSGISMSLNEANGVNGVSNVPYIRTGGIRTGNPSGTTNNQYGINIDTLSISISGNGSSKIITGGSQGLTITGIGKTRQDLTNNYTIYITGGALFDYGIEKTITITSNITDRKGNSATNSIISFNSPVGPTSLGSFSPNNLDNYVNISSPIKLGIQDNRAGVNSGSIRITIMGISGTNYGPFIFSGIDLNLSGSSSTANQPNYYINITGHDDFPISGTIKIIVYAEDMEGNIDTINDYIFTTRPDCTELQCCITNIKIKGNETIYIKPNLYILGGINPSFSTGSDGTGNLSCNIENEGTNIYEGSEQNSVNATLLGFNETNELIFSGRDSISAIISGETIYFTVNIFQSLDLTGAILFNENEVSTGTLVGSGYIDFTIENTLNTGAILQSPLEENLQNIIEAYIPEETKIITTGNLCDIKIIESPIFSGIETASLALSNYNISTVIKVGSPCLGTKIEFENLTGEAKEVTIRIKDSNLTGNGTVKVWYSNDLINRNSHSIANVSNYVAEIKTTHFTYFALGEDKPVRERPIGGGGGGGGGPQKDYCPDGDFSDSYYDNNCGDETVHGISTTCEVGKTKYNKEQIGAFQYAYGLGITTKCPIERSRIEDPIIRKELAKMISEFAIKTIGIYPDFSKKDCDIFKDIEKESDEFKFYIKLSCKLGLMGLESDGIKAKENFDPNQYVSRAQFGTIMSRLVFGGKYNGNKDNRYIDHLNALKKYKIMKYIENPQMKELRGYIMIMMQRVDESGIVKKLRPANAFINGAYSLFHSL